MRYHIVAEESLVRACRELSGLFGFTCGEEGIEVNVSLGNEELEYAYRGGVLSVKASKRVEVFYALKAFSDTFARIAPKEGFVRRERRAFRDLCYMYDCSRNAVPKTETVFELVRHLAVLGYDTLGLYMEDTFVIRNQPYFGYLRTPFTKEEIGAADEYCKLFGIELVPFVQTLAHFNSLIRHYAMAHLFDFNDILLVGEEKTYEFLEDVISTCAEYFSCRRINIGMDEAYMLGRGTYMDRHGARPRFDIMAEHLKRVLAICNKYGFRASMWSDMFFSLTMNGQYGEDLPQEMIEKIPEDVELVYWDYYHTHEADYDEMMKKHRVFRNEIGFATGAWKWLGFTPDNRYSFVCSAESAKACIKNGIRDYIVTGWGDNGAECALFAILPALAYCSAFNYGKFERDGAFRRSFRSLSGMELDAFMTVDPCNRVTRNDDVEEKNSANKYLLFNDVLLGTLDTTLGEGASALYREHALALAKAKKRAGKWTYLFETQYRLAQVLEIKAELGIILRRAYQSGDRGALEGAYAALKKLPARIRAFYRAFRAQWDRENRPYGFDVQDLRIGALERRVNTAIEKIGAFLEGKAERVPELEEKLLDFMGHVDEFEEDPDQCEWRWSRMSSVNVNY